MLVMLSELKKYNAIKEVLTSPKPITIQRNLNLMMIELFHTGQKVNQSSVVMVKQVSCYATSPGG